MSKEKRQDLEKSKSCLFGGVSTLYDAMKNFRGGFSLAIIIIA